MALQVSMYASGLAEQPVCWWKWEFEKVQWEVIQGQKQPVKSLAVGWIQAKKWSLLKQLHRLSSLHFYFSILLWFSLRWNKRKNHVDILSACLPLGMVLTVLLVGCKFVLYPLPYLQASQAHSGGKWCWRGHWGRVGKKIVAKCGSFRYLSQGSLSLSKSQCMAWLPDQISSYVLQTHNGNYRVL